MRAKSAEEFDNDISGLAAIEEIFSSIDTGAQAGCGPLFLATDISVLEKRVKLLFQNKISQLVDEISDEVRGGSDKAEELVRRAYDNIIKYGAKYDKDAFRPVWAHFKSKGKEKAPKIGTCYLDPRLWLFPRVERSAPDIKSLWDIKPKLVFRDIYDPDDKVITAAVDTKGVVIDNHFFNGGVYVASVTDKNGNSKLTTKGTELRKKFESDEQFLFYIAAILNSPQATAWSKSTPQERIKIPLEVNQTIAKKCADIESKLPKIWLRENERSMASAVTLLLNDLKRNKVGDLKERVASALKNNKISRKKSGI